MLHVMKPLLLKQLTQLNELSSIIVCRDHLSARSQRQLRNITTGKFQFAMNGLQV